MADDVKAGVEEDNQREHEEAGFDPSSLTKYVTEKAAEESDFTKPADESPIQKWKVVFSVDEDVIRNVLEGFSVQDDELEQRHIVHSFNELLRDAIDGFIGERRDDAVICQSARMYP